MSYVVRSCDPYRYSSVCKLEFVLDNHTVSDLCATLFIYHATLQLANFPFLDVSFTIFGLCSTTPFVALLTGELSF